MSKFLCILFAIALILCGCATHPQKITFQEQYNIYADPVVDYSNMVIAIPGADPYPAMAFEQCGLDIDTLQDFIDAIVRRMDARNLVQYHAIQNEVDELYRKLCNTLDMNDTKTLYTWPEGYAYRVLSGYYKTRDEYGLKAAFATIQYMKYQLKL
ncbi:hypothetical protein F4009_17040 [Candidatus Poribacteria bacterium]|nr:hypothetical protein [Candidatus Poribacteria bacterium]MDE0397433.1 hypothetical protein [Candidatus Poribacteria bacterium]MYH80256.1 hypothetical protein [Candidatus Poribacteria bacterium]MYK95677.1 hypothetical protein [Candidatus Poribacteria bacterium]